MNYHYSLVTLGYIEINSNTKWSVTNNLSSPHKKIITEINILLKGGRLFIECSINI